jgi:hypothetical protein
VLAGARVISLVCLDTVISRYPRKRARQSAVGAESLENMWGWGILVSRAQVRQKATVTYMSHCNLAAASVFCLNFQSLDSIFPLSSALLFSCSISMSLSISASLGMSEFETCFALPKSFHCRPRLCVALSTEPEVFLLAVEISH